MKAKFSAIALAALLFAATAACSSSESTDASDEAANGDECVKATDAELDALFTEWNDALLAGDAAKVAELYRKDAVLLPTLSATVASTPEAITEYFIGLLEAKPDARMDESFKKSYCNVAYNVGRWTINANGADVAARVTWVYGYENGEWLIAHHHSSVNPT